MHMEDHVCSELGNRVLEYMLQVICTVKKHLSIKDIFGLLYLT